MIHSQGLVTCGDVLLVLLMTQMAARIVWQVIEAIICDRVAEKAQSANKALLVSDQREDESYVRAGVDQIDRYDKLP